MGLGLFAGMRKRGRSIAEKRFSNVFMGVLGSSSVFASVELCSLASKSCTPSTIMKSMTEIGARVIMAL